VAVAAEEAVRSRSLDLMEAVELSHLQIILHFQLIDLTRLILCSLKEGNTN